MRVIYLSVMWGEKHINTFMNYVLPSLIKTDNKKAIENQKYYIYTDRNGQELIREHNNFSEFNSLCKVVFKGLIGEDRGDILMNCFNDAILSAKESNSLVHLITCDSIYSPNGLSNTLKKMKDYDACVLPAGATRVNESFLDSYSVDMTPQEFTNAFIEHMHSETKQHFKDSDKFVPTAVMYIEKKDDGLFVKSFYHQPGYMRVNSIGNYDNLELNGVLGLSPKKVYCVKDSDEMMVASVTEPRYKGWEGKFNESDFNLHNQGNKNRISNLSFESGFLIKGKV